MNKTAVRYSVVSVSLLLTTVLFQAQTKLLNPTELSRKFSQVWETSETSRKNYSWKAKTEVVRNDKVVQVLVEEISSKQDGSQTRKVVSNQEAPLPSTLLIRKIAEEQKSKIIAFMSDLRSFLEKYALTDDSTRNVFFSRAKISPPDAKGQLLVSGSNVFAPGDQLKWWIDTRSYTITYATISTTFRGINAEFSATYYLLPGMNYMAQAKIRVPSKEMVINLKFYDFVKR